MFHPLNSEAASFTDLDRVPWAYDAISFLNQKDIVRGYDNDHFGPNDHITRAQAALMLVNALYRDVPNTGDSIFTDVKRDNFYYDTIALAAEKGLVNGYPDQTYLPNKAVTRAEATVMINQAFQIDEKAGAIGFSDVTPIKWARESIINLSSAGIINGYPNGLFEPNRSITRAEFSVILAAALEPSFRSIRNFENEFTSHQLNNYEKEVVALTNKERTQNGLKPLLIDVKLSRVANYKSRDMELNNYFDHNSPTYGSPFDMMSSYDISFRSAGENIAYGYPSPKHVVEGWMNSPGHRMNILTEYYTHIGVGYYQSKDGPAYWTQMFIRK